MILRAKTKYLFDQFALTEKQQANTKKNLQEIDERKWRLESAPRRLVLELTNACNLNCMMCGRNEAKFVSTFFDPKWLKKFTSILDMVEEVSLFGWGEPTVHPKFAEILKTLDHFPLRKYFCTNGMRLNTIKDVIFDTHVDLIAISLDGAVSETNDRIRRGGSLDKIVQSLWAIVQEKKVRGVDRPYMNFVFCAMASNVQELPDLVKLAAEIGLEEVKVVYFTAFSERLKEESLWNCKEEVKRIFQKAEDIAVKLHIRLKLPHLQGEDPAGIKPHKDCFVGWRDLFLGSDGFIRPCMSTSEKFFSIHEYETFDSIWNHLKFQNFRQNVNDEKRMGEPCRSCYQSSHCNWNKEESFLQLQKKFAPKWVKNNENKKTPM